MQAGRLRACGGESGRGRRRDAGSCPRAIRPTRHSGTQRSDRWIPPESHERPRQVLERHFPDLVGAAINETRACHYESSVTRNFIIDHHPDLDNVWLLGGGSAEAFKFGPVLGEYIAKRVLDMDDEPDLAEGFALTDEEFGARGR